LECSTCLNISCFRSVQKKYLQSLGVLRLLEHLMLSFAFVYASSPIKNKKTPIFQCDIWLNLQDIHSGSWIQNEIQLQSLRVLRLLSACLNISRKHMGFLTGFKTIQNYHSECD
jgi:hypothetical protein